MFIMIIILGIAILAAAIYFLIKRTPTPKSIGGKAVNSSTEYSSLQNRDTFAYPPFRDQGKFSFETRILDGVEYVWKDGKWEKISK